MGTAGQHIAWTAPRTSWCGCASCDLCHDDEQVVILPARTVRPVERKPVRQVQSQREAIEAAQAAVFAALDCY